MKHDTSHSAPATTAAPAIASTFERAWGWISGSRKASLARRAELSRALCRAARRGDAKEIASLLERGADATLRDEDGMTPLMLCALDAKPDCVALLAPESDCSASSDGGFNALHWACFAPLNAMDAMGCATMSTAKSAIMDSFLERAEACILILMRVCDPRAETSGGKRASAIASEAGRDGIAESLRSMELAIDERHAIGVAANDASSTRRSARL